MNQVKVFVLGTIAGAIAVWLWRREIEGDVGDQTRGVRARAAEAMRAVGEKAGQVLDRGGDSLRRAERQEAIRPPSTAREA